MDRLTGYTSGGSPGAGERIGDTSLPFSGSSTGLSADDFAGPLAKQGFTRGTRPGDAATPQQSSPQTRDIAVTQVSSASSAGFGESDGNTRSMLLDGSTRSETESTDRIGSAEADTLPPADKPASPTPDQLAAAPRQSSSGQDAAPAAPTATPAPGNTVAGTAEAAPNARTAEAPAPVVQATAAPAAASAPEFGDPQANPAAQNTNDANSGADSAGTASTLGSTNHAPTALAISGTTIVENAAGATVGRVTASDPDAGASHTFSVSDSRFEVVDGTLKLRDGQSLDHEAEPTVTLNVTATDQGGLARTEAFTITVGNANETPTDISLSASTVTENAAGAAIGTLSATDPDAGATHTFSVSDNRFEVVGNSLKLKAGQSLDFESTPTVDVQVTATDQGGLARTEAFTITVGNANETPTDISLSASTVTENAAGAAIGTLSATDPDAGATHTFTVSDSRFEVVDGTLKLRDGQSLDHEAEPTVTLNVTATDQGGLARTEAFTITVGNANETPTDISLSASTVTENAAGAAIGTLSATDPDAGATHTFTVSDSRFEVVDGTLKLRDGQSLDHEAEPTVTLNVTATDQGGLARTEAFTITVGNANETPTDISLSASTVTENAAGATIGTLSAADPDAGATHTFTVSDSRFEVVGNSLKLKAGQSLDFESTPTVAVSVTATDQGGLSRTQGFTVNVNNVNEAPTAVSLSASTVNENAAGATIGTLSATDPDAGATHTFTVSDNRFEVVGNSLKLKAGQSLDFESTPTVAVSVTATDQGGLSRTQGFTVNVNNVNEAPTAVSLSASTVNENAAGATIGTLSATDPDAGATHTFTVSDNRFEVIGNSLKLKAGQSLDFESTPTVAVSVTATDQGGLSTTQGFTVNVNNVNEAPTDITLSGSSVTENSAGATIGRLAAIDPDASESHSFSVSDNRFEVLVDGTLKLKTGQSLDFETEPAVNIDVTATDHGGLTHTETFTVNVLNAVEGNPGVTLTGTNSIDLLSGGSRDDILQGQGGLDLMFGGSGNDTMDGGDDLDFVYGGDGNDSVSGGNDTDFVYGGNGNDTVAGNAGDDMVFGGSGQDSVTGGTGNDILLGDDGNDTIIGGQGADVMFGGAGNDRFVHALGDGSDTVDGGTAGGWIDTLVLQNAAGGHMDNSGWTLSLDSGHIESNTAGVVTLSQDASGDIVFSNGEHIAFTDLERIEY